MNDLIAKSDAELDEIFAVEVSGIVKPDRLRRGDKAKGIVARFVGETTIAPGAQPRTFEVIKWSDGSYGGDRWPNYCEYAAAVIPFIEKFLGEKYTLQIWFNAPNQPDRRWACFQEARDGDPLLNCYASTLARAMVLALITFKRSQK
jgi:hypothetical protein